MSFHHNLTEDDQRCILIPNKIIDQLLKIRFNTCQWNIIFFLLVRKFDKIDHDQASVHFIANRIEYREVTVHRHIQKLVAKGILMEIPHCPPHKMTHYALNINIDDWIVQ